MDSSKMPNAGFPSLLVCRGLLEKQVILLDKPVMIIGRTAPAEILLDHPQISRQHARITVEDGQYYLEDLNSRNGTCLNGSRVTGKVPVQPGDSITLGDQVLVLFQQEVVEMVTPAAQTPVIKTEAASLPVNDQTMVDAVEMPVIEAARQCQATLVVTIAGQPSTSYPIDRERTTIGRADDCHIVVHSPVVSRRHAVIECQAEGYVLIVSPDATNTLTCQGRAVTGQRLLKHGDILRIDSNEPGLMVSIAFQQPAAAPVSQRVQAIQFSEKERLTFGRDASNDVVLDMPAISRYHAQVERVGRRYFVTDLHSTNGTFINNERVTTKTEVHPKDTLRVGPYRFVLGEDQLVKYDDTSGLRVEAFGLQKWVRKNLNILQDISLVFQPREFVVVVGQSGGGKSTLVDAIAGYRPATDGKVVVNGIDVYHNFDAVRNEVGFVPQRDIIHMELTVYQALDYAARLRMPRDTSKTERHNRIMEVLEDLDLEHRKDAQISALSGGQQKRVSIGVELITRPGLFFLDEPTSGLDPGTETVFMHLCRRLADQGRTIIMVTHATKNVMLADKVVFLARGGYLAWFGPPDEALAYFDQYRTERERRTCQMEFDQIYAILDDQSRGTAKEWAQRFQECSAYQSYIVEPLKLDAHKLPLVQKGAEAVQPAKDTPRRKKRSGAKISSLKQFFVLSARNLKILSRDRTSLILMILIAPAVGALDLIIAPLMGREPYHWTNGVADKGILTLFLLTLYTLLVGGLSQMREFVKETEIYKRERLVNLRILPYVASKIWVACLLAMFHALAYLVLHSVAFKMPLTVLEFGLVYATLFFAVLSGMIAGLLASAMSPSASSAPMLTILFIIPQIVLGGVLTPLPTSISQVASLHWTMKGLVGIVGVGSDVAADTCWKLDPALQDIMTLEQKDQFGCRCMGLNLYREGSCAFPGLGAFNDTAILSAAPSQPADMPPEPPQPIIPPRPDKPADAADPIAMVGFLNSLDSYLKDVDRIQAEYMSEVALYKAQAEEYQAQMAKYQTDLIRYNIERTSAVEAGEALITTINEKFDWTYVNKEDPQDFYPWLFGTWRAQAVIIGVYVAAILFLIKRKDIR